MSRPEPSRYRHAEAFALMTYRADDGTEEEQVFNSRDGVTPFTITLRSGKPASHVNWQDDQRMPEDWTPPAGMRRFADMTRDRAREHATANLDRWAADPAMTTQVSRLGDREEAIAALTESYWQPGAPDLQDPQEAR